VYDIADLQARAQQVMDPTAFDYFVGGAGEEITASENGQAWSDIRLRPHVLRDVSAASTATTLLGTDLTAPILVPPMGYLRLADDRGEVAMAEGAAAAGAVLCVSTMATISMEEVAAAKPQFERWFQIYVHTDRGLTRDLVERARDAGYQALVFTVDLPVLPKRKRDVRNQFDLPPGMELANLGVGQYEGAGSALEAYADSSLDPALTPEDIGWLREISGLPVVVKGVLRGDDADIAVNAGASGVIVSNHGGRQLDTVVPTAVALPDVVSAVGARVPVLVDGGVRSGTDIVKALALGAAAVLVGRPLLWALAVDGSTGVTGLLDQLGEELARSMALCGVSSIADIDVDLIVPVPRAETAT
jgi:4-hydroxymandelate oxidase